MLYYPKFGSVTGVRFIGTSAASHIADLTPLTRMRSSQRPLPASSSRTSTKSGAPGGEQERVRVSWNKHEDDIIRSGVGRNGPRWSLIAAQLPGRTEHAVRNRWHRLQCIDNPTGAINVLAQSAMRKEVGSRSSRDLAEI